MVGWLRITVNTSLFTYVSLHSWSSAYICVISAYDLRQPPEEKRTYWFVMKKDYDEIYSYVALGDKWVCIGDRYDDGVMYVNLKAQGCWAVAKRAVHGKGIRHDGERLSERGYE
jgi:hypothetical protein